MQPLHELLHRIKWDAEFSKGEFALGYYDRVAHEERVVKLASVDIRAASGSFTYHDEDGIQATVPLHRVRTVYKDGHVIWHRPGGATEPGGSTGSGEQAGRP